MIDNLPVNQGPNQATIIESTKFISHTVVPLI